MHYSIRRLAVLTLPLLALASLQAATVSRQSAETFSQKVTLIRQQAQTSERVGARRTPLTQDELNSWFAYQAAPLLPNGVTQPQVTIVGQGKVSGQAVVDLDAIAKKRASGGTFDPWSLVGGRVPVTVTGVLHTRDGKGRFEAQSAEIAGLPVPSSMLQELVSYYSRSPERPQGLRIDETFPLPANILQIEVGPGQAVVVQ
ncbi:MAG: hypothetical protein A3F70_13580 [Acidobacteria bacterium RIFCSPLOWO2_12_FULL_67_14]|nr:MAG: hypothetical protein A3H29_04475 [Acidobacteria bacterium RIFCSPLOWO2_02_FULL_67_21]OFW39574.1 MAG: hypothetical protein A3F70_13580 [Acidobacteria bacterium RIFCSPLOWO2_12_FULL_67_14]